MFQSMPPSQQHNFLKIKVHHEEKAYTNTLIALWAVVPNHYESTVKNEATQKRYETGHNASRDVCTLEKGAHHGQYQDYKKESLEYNALIVQYSS